MFENLSAPEKSLIACGVALLPIIAMMMWNSHKVSKQERAEAIIRCEQADDTPVCLAGIEARHDECLEAATFGGGKFDKSSVHPANYDFCVREGVEAMRKKRAEDRRRR